VGIPGNERADGLAKAALSSDNMAEFPVPASDLRFHIKKHIQDKWQQRWDTETHNKLHLIKPKIGPWPPLQRESRREDTPISPIAISLEEKFSPSVWLVCVR